VPQSGGPGGRMTALSGRAGSAGAEGGGGLQVWTAGGRSEDGYGEGGG
jgi:hypothetical protein